MAQILLLRGAMGAGKSTAAAALRELLPEVVFIEVDDIKVHGSSKKNDTERKFREAGAQAKKAMEAGNDVVVIEPLCTREHINFVLNEAGVAEALPNVLSVWLDCTLKTALERKGKDFTDAEIRHQHTRYATRYVLNNEVIVRTDELSRSEVANQVCKHFQNGIAT